MCQTEDEKLIKTKLYNLKRHKSLVPTTSFMNCNYTIKSEEMSDLKNVTQVLMFGFSSWNLGMSLAHAIIAFWQDMRPSSPAVYQNFVNSCKDIPKQWAMQGEQRGKMSAPVIMRGDGNIDCNDGKRRRCTMISQARRVCDYRRTGMHGRWNSSVLSCDLRAGPERREAAGRHRHNTHTHTHTEQLQINSLQQQPLSSPAATRSATSKFLPLWGGGEGTGGLWAQCCDCDVV